MAYRIDTDTEDRVPTGRQATSKVSAKEVGRKKNDYRQKIYGLIAYRGGMTCEDVESTLGIRHQTASCIIRFLTQDGFLRDSGERRRAKSGRQVIVWKTATPQPPTAVQMDLIADPLKAGI